MVAKKDKTAAVDIEASKAEAMRIRFRRVLGETVPSHTIKMTRKKIASEIKMMQDKEKLRSTENA